MVLAYNQAVVETTSEQLLFNIARARHHEPIHFTGVSHIAATLNFQFNAGATPALTGSNGALLAPIFGGNISENPTISIIPIGGEEFTKRLLAPIPESKLTFLLRQGADIDKILRLMAEEFRELKNGAEVIYYNRPSDQSGYPVFRRILLHLSSIQDRRHLHVDPLIIQRKWTLPPESMAPEGFLKLHDTFSITYNPESRLYILSQSLPGRVLIILLPAVDCPLRIVCD